MNSPKEMLFAYCLSKLYTVKLCIFTDELFSDGFNSGLMSHKLCTCQFYLRSHYLIFLGFHSK